MILQRTNKKDFFNIGKMVKKGGPLREGKKARYPRKRRRGSMSGVLLAKNLSVFGKIGKDQKGGRIISSYIQKRRRGNSVNWGGSKNKGTNRMGFEQDKGVGKNDRRHIETD